MMAVRMKTIKRRKRERERGGGGSGRERTFGQRERRGRVREWIIRERPRDVDH